MLEGLQTLKTGHEAHTNVPVEEQQIDLIYKNLLSAVYKEKPGGHAHLNGIMQNIFKDLTKNPAREKKYKAFIQNVFHLTKLWEVTGLPHNEERFRAMVLIYAQQRLVDDIIDGDTPVKSRPEDRVAYVEQRLQNISTGNFDRNDPIDSFSIRILADIKVLDPGYVEKAKERLEFIMRSILFDGKRITEVENGTREPFKKREELEKHFFDLDIQGTIGLTLFLFGFEDSEANMAILEPLGQATRVSYNLKDFSEDIRAALCNIPAEDAFRLRITQADLDAAAQANNDFGKCPANIRKWIREQIERGESLLKKHSKQPVNRLALLPSLRKLYRGPQNILHVQALKRLVLQLGYIKEATQVFKDASKSLDIYP